MFEIPISPLSVNQALAGKRYKTAAYKTYETELSVYFKKLDLPKIRPKDPFYLYFEFGTISRQDLSNNLKLLEDCICRYLGVDDRYVMSIYCRKIITKKVDAFIRFNIFGSEHELITAITNEV